ncbi:MAG: hypothetical protein ABFS22_12210, partial [Pseudomonadota bacterium]
MRITTTIRLIAFWVTFAWAINSVAADGPALTLVVSTTTPNYSAVGNTIDYSYAVTNSGNVA